jgi:acyl-coenzyme A synthetase/AMP-(fatty) acid ligase/acyl carrier protein
VVRVVKNTDYARLEGEVFLQFAPISFDAATLEIWGPLLNGGRLVVYRPGATSLEELGAEIERSGITTLWLTSGLFHQMVEHQLESLRGVRQLMSGGDVLSVSHCRRVLESLPGTTLVNGYGPTECTTFTCCYPMRGVEALGETVSIGHPIANTRVYILDRHMEPVPVGVWGELYVGGDGVARGYLNSEELTAERFVLDPFSNGAPPSLPGASGGAPPPLPGASGEARGRLYRTGDMVRWLEDGRIEFQGRMDFQVKLRGFRVELGEIESVLNRHSGVGESVVLLREDTPGDKRLVGYVVPRDGPAADVQSLRAFLREQLPDYMVPAAFVTLDAFPLTPNGKVNRRALPAPEEDAFAAGAGAKVEPRTDVERALADIWREVLKIERIGIHDDFFDLGGHSLLATQVVSRVRDSFQLDIPLRRLFEAPTIAGFGAILEEALLEEIEKLSQEDAVRRLSEGPGL